MSELDPLEDMMSQLGDLGRYQIFQHILHLVAATFAGFHMLTLTFTAPDPKHRCHIEEIDGIKPQFDSDYNVNHTENKDLFKESIIKDYIPKNGIHFSQCERKTKSGGKTTCNRYVYAFDVYHPTSYVVRYNMVCKDEYKRPLMRVIYIFGVLTGCIVLGPLGDKVGRKPILCISAWLQVIFGISSAFVTNYWVHLGVLFIYGAFASGGAYVTGFVLSMELVGAPRRTFCGTNFSAVFTLGKVLLVAIAALIGNTTHLQVTYGCCSLVMAGYWWLCDESIRWLWSAGKRKEAIRLAKKAARWNNFDFEDRYSATIEEQNVKPATVYDVSPNDFEASNYKDKEYGLCTLLKYRVLRSRLLLLSVCWFANSIVYYGIAFRGEDLSDSEDLYLNFFLTNMAELPGYVILNFGILYTGSRAMMAINLGIGGVMCFICLALEKNAASITFAVLAVMAVTISFAVAYNYTAELFPTVARSSAVGFCSSAARLAGMSTPMLSLLHESYAIIPVVIFGSVAIIGAIIAAFLPETLEKKLTQTMLDGEKFRIGDTAFNTCRSNRVENKVEEESDDSDPLAITNSVITTNSKEI